MIRNPIVAGQFYPGNKVALRAEVDKFLAHTEPEPAPGRQKALLVMVPHAGYIYSGALAGQVFSQVEIPERVLLLGPNHRGVGYGAALADYQAWQTPLGLVEQDKQLFDLLLQKTPLLQADNRAHSHEHSLEVELPFLQVLQPNLKINAISLGRVNLSEIKQLAQGISEAIITLQQPVLLVASTDMNHYLPADATIMRDNLALEQVLAMKPAELYEVVSRNQISMCGVLPVSLGMEIAIKLGASQVRLVGHTHSGQVSGDNLRVVGYAGALFY